MAYQVTRTDEQWRSELSGNEYAVLREAATERPWTGELLEEKRLGTYRCRACGQVLFRAETKFDSHCGWPSFYRPAEGDAVELVETGPSGWCGPRFAARGAARTSATSSTTRRRPRPATGSA